MSLKKLLIVFGLMLVAAAILAACGTQAPPTTAPTEGPAPTPTAAPLEVPFKDAWSGSGHADINAEAFTHWNEEDPAEVPTSCAKCHTAAGYQDFLGADGSAPAVVDAAVPAHGNPGITCVACHNAVTLTKTSVVMPSGIELTGLGDESRCMECHQGRESKVTVDAQIEKFNAQDALDTVVAPIKDDKGNDVKFGFRNIHYFAAAATLYGTEAKGGYEYDGKSYDAKHDHVPGYDTCIGCHDSHTLQVKVEKCAGCHDGVTTVEDLKNVREVSSAKDYDGDGDTKEGMFHEIEGLQQALLAEITTYAKDKAGSPIGYDVATYPYFFTDANENGTLDEGEGAYANWTPRLLKAAYNYQVSIKDPGSFAHGNKYIVELLYDSIEDLGGDVSKLARDDAGHFAGNTEPFRHWDGEEAGGIVPGSCAKCHSAAGLPQFIKEGVTVSQPASNGFQCSTCHDEANWPNRYAFASVVFPSGKTVSFATDADGKPAPDDSNLCIACHQGRESTVSVNQALAGLDPDTVSDKIRFRNVHYFAAGATLFGDAVQGAYQFDGKTYVGQNVAHPLNKCKDCHDVHALEPKLEACASCHGGAKPEDIRFNTDTTDWDGDGNVTEGVKGEIDTLAEALYAQMQTYAEAHGGAIKYDGAAYPYFFGADGKSYATWTPNLMKAAYNYQYVNKDPGAFVHNPKYVMQFLIDSIEALGGNVSTYTRPE
ncbi:MAG: hypothetical protein ACM3QS_06560 [Bacteroidota bacterium]